MSADYKLVLGWIARLSRLQKDNKGISLTHLARHSSYSLQELDHIIRLLEQEGYIATEHPAPKITLIKPTISGYEKAQEWDKQALAKAPKGKLLTFGKVIGASLVAALLGILWWWIGLSPSTADIAPLQATIPIRVYHESMLPPNYLALGAWYHFPNAPEIGMTVSAKDYKETDDVLSDWVPEYTPVTFDGKVVIVLKVESVITPYDIDIDSIIFKVIRKPVSSPENIYYVPPALGGEKYIGYELPLNPETLLSKEDGIEYYQGVIKVDGEEVDYVSVGPQGSEIIEVSLQLDQPNYYELTPIIHYSYRDKQSSVEGADYAVVYPEEYRSWIWESESMSCQGDICTGGGGEFVASPIILDTQTDNIVIEKQTKLEGVPACYPERKWIAFESSMVTFGFMDRVFLIDTMGDQLRPVSMTDLHNTKRKLAWLQDGSLLVGEPASYDESIRDYQYNNFVVNPLTLEKHEQPTGSNSAVLNNDYTEKNKTCFNDNSGCIEQKADKDTNGYYGIDSQDLQHLFMVREGVETPFAYISEHSQIDPVISPDDTWIAYIEKREIKNNDGYVSYVEGISVAGKDGALQWKVKDFDGWYENLSWSPDGKSLLYVGYRPINGVGELGSDNATSNYHAYIMNLETGIERVLTSYDTKYPYFEWGFSQDGQWIVIGGDRLTIAALDGVCSQDIFIPPSYSGRINISNILLQP